MNALELIKVALKEDLPNGDITTDNLGMPPRLGTAKLIAKQDMIVSGYSLFEQTILLLDPNAKIRWHFTDGDRLLKGQVLASIHADLIQLLKAERVALNFLMHLSGIATLTAQFVSHTKGTSTKILDTRKTLPGYRELEKKAVKDGGGHNHRMNLSEAILIKDNHIALVGGISEAIRRIRIYSQDTITVEVSSPQQVTEAIAANANRLLLDNMSLEMIQSIRSQIPFEIKTEVSGNITLEKITPLCQLGIDFISIGALTHSAPSADISLLFDWST